MAKIFIDTNKFLDFYRYKEENKEVLDKLSLTDNIIITRQVIEEFNRNRLSEIKKISDMVKKKKSELTDGLCNLDVVGIFSDEILNINKMNSKLIREIKKNLNPLEEEINKMITDDSKDIVFEVFKKILKNEKTIIIEDDDEIYNLAVKRNRLGGVPRSDKNKYFTICDEYIWESLLMTIDEDLIFVTRDDTYFDNDKILTEEFRRKTGKNIVFTKWLSTALKELGFKISREAIDKEQKEQNNLVFLEELSNATGIDVNYVEEELIFLSELEEQIIKLRFGLIDGKRHTLEEVGKAFNLSREEIRQIEAKGLRKMRTRKV